MNKQPHFILSICFVLGIAFQEEFLWSENAVFAILFLTFILLILLFSKSLKILRWKNFYKGMLFFFLGILMHFVSLNRFKNISLKTNETLVFELSKKLNSTVKNRKYEIVAWREGENEESKMILLVPKKLPELDFTHFYKAKLFVNQIEKPKNDYQFDYQKYLKRKGIFRQAYLREKVLQTPKITLNLADRIRQKHLEILRRIDASSLSTTTKDFIKGIVLADRTDMDQSLISDFQKSGLIHILAISGTHIAIIFGLFYGFFNVLVPKKWNRWAIILSLLSIWCFGLFIGLGNSVFRACLMLSIYFVYVILQRKPDLLHALSLAAFVILILDTNQLFDVGFQLSFSAVFGIFWLQKPIKGVFPKPKNRITNFFYNIFSATMASQIGTLPLLLYYFHQFSGISLLANLVVIPLLQIVIISSFCLVILISFGVFFEKIFRWFDVVIQYLLKLVHWFASFDGLQTKLIPLQGSELIVLVVLIYLSRFLFKGFSLRKLKLFCVGLIIFFVLRMGLNGYQQNKDEVVIHYYFKERFYSNKVQSKVTFFLPENVPQEKVERIVIEPYLISRRVKDYKIVKVPATSKGIEINGKLFPINP